MIVDLVRNDISRICKTASVKVPHLLTRMKLPNLDHLVSTVCGELEDGTNWNDIFTATFPPGSVTGAPKLSALEFISENEPNREVYCGAIGYLSADGRMDTNIAIRTLLCHRGRMYCWAGGGIVMDSGLESEYAESLAKASAMLEVFARAEPAHVGRQDRR